MAKSSSGPLFSILMIFCDKNHDQCSAAVHLSLRDLAVTVQVKGGDLPWPPGIGGQLCANLNVPPTLLMVTGEIEQVPWNQPSEKLLL